MYPDAYREIRTNTLRSKGAGRRSPNPYSEPALSATQQQMQIPRVPGCAGSAGLYVRTRESYTNYSSRYESGTYMYLNLVGDARHQKRGNP